MKRKTWFMCLLVLLLIAPLWAEEQGDKVFPLETKFQKNSYAAGYRLGAGLQKMVREQDIDLTIALQGMLDGAKNQPRLPESQLVRIYALFKKELQKRREERQKVQAYQNDILGKRFLRENREKEGIKETPSGLQYKIIKQGEGQNPGPRDIALVHYRGTLMDGTEIFSTYHSKALYLPVDRSLPAWKEGLQLMKKGSKFTFYIPPKLAYKHFGNPPLIPPNAVLIYEAELIAIEKQKKEQK